MWYKNILPILVALLRGFCCLIIMLTFSYFQHEIYNEQLCLYFVLCCVIQKHIAHFGCSVGGFLFHNHAQFFIFWIRNEYMNNHVRILPCTVWYKNSVHLGCSIEGFLLFCRHVQFFSFFFFLNACVILCLQECYNYSEDLFLLYELFHWAKVLLNAGFDSSFKMLIFFLCLVIAP